uniref:SJCHGC02446 protein n=1 Tax=Schistosoma japonicum TaxID=6182 RepID=Q5DBE4_SCHJA|nr:SJCHGC02446 protein [Schistosoma japonicum]
MNPSLQFLDTASNATVHSIYRTILSISWRNELWLVSLIGFHILTSVCIIVLRKRTNFLLCILFIFLGTVWCSQWINELAASYWNMFATEQYFDSYGYFISCIWSIPVILNSLTIIVLLVLQINSLVVQSKRLQVANKKHLKKE